ncbi:hypothetical protein W97_03348 [Coniosporium apollinis CBS 100218]|uniref:Major facilitator superfamily (MFS) profile domain-containing protein n=1 Tax=Coniosporium apollinis (strain CBS 100218) TaxID=1168221 RepID=R7YQK5_CONA1|nr:uncharacterized protein W97_03348 [Coniosporium apollinis CBS 100218]EON64118.1 hypothetical protein W97_03348 [Coniosporium apollinis CBS 100218]
MATGSNRNLYLAATVACLTGALFGYSVGFIGGILVLPSFQHHFRLDKLPAPDLAAAQASTVTIWLVGALFGVPLGMPVCSSLGRRRCLSFCALLYVLGAVLQLVDVSSSLAVFNAGRLLNGLGVGAGTLVSPMYISEISTPSARGMLLSGYQTAIQLAALAGFWAAFAAHATLADSSALQWEIPVAVQLVPGVLLLLGTLFIPEAPRYLVDTGKDDAAQDALAWLRSLPREDPDIQDELSELQETTPASDVPTPSLLAIVKQPSIRKRLGVGIGLMIAQNMVGLNALNYYAPVIFMSAGFNTVSSSLFLTGLFGLTKLFSAISFMFVFVRLRGNRFWLQLGSGICGISMVILAICVRSLLSSSSSTEAHLTVQGVISVLMVYIFAFAFGISLGPISWNVCSEIFPAAAKAKCCGITTCVQWLFQIVIAGITPHLLANVGWATYLVYAACCAASFVWVRIAVPETKGVKLGREMDELFSVGDKDELLRFEEGETEERRALLGERAMRTGRRDSVGFPV